ARDRTQLTVHQRHQLIERAGTARARRSRRVHYGNRELHGRSISGSAAGLRVSMWFHHATLTRSIAHMPVPGHIGPLVRALRTILPLSIIAAACTPRGGSEPAPL